MTDKGSKEENCLLIDAFVYGKILYSLADKPRSLSLTDTPARFVYQPHLSLRPCTFTLVTGKVRCLRQYIFQRFSIFPTSQIGIYQYKLTIICILFERERFEIEGTLNYKLIDNQIYYRAFSSQFKLFNSFICFSEKNSETERGSMEKYALGLKISSLY